MVSEGQVSEHGPAACCVCRPPGSTRSPDRVRTRAAPVALHTRRDQRSPLLCSSVPAGAAGRPLSAATCPTPTALPQRSAKLGHSSFCPSVFTASRAAPRNTEHSVLAWSRGLCFPPFALGFQDQDPRFSAGRPVPEVLLRGPASPVRWLRAHGWPGWDVWARGRETPVRLQLLRQGRLFPALVSQTAGTMMPLSSSSPPVCFAHLHADLSLPSPCLVTFSSQLSATADL